MKPIDDTQWSTLSVLLGDSATQLFEYYKVPIKSAQHHGDREGQPGELAAFIGFTGAHMKGSLLLTTSRALVTASNPQTASGTILPEEDLRDWLGELSNQLVGRLKIKLLDYGVAIDLSTPTTLAGDMLRGGSAGPMSGRLSTFFCGDHVVEVFFNVKIADGVTLAYNPLPADEQSAEGDLMFF
jgi:CheY-specific phosphatase CheX